MKTTLILAGLLAFARPGATQLNSELMRAGTESFNQGEYEVALSSWQKGLEWARETKNEKSEGDFLQKMGLAYRYMGKYPESIEHYERALKIHRKLGDADWTARSLVGLGKIQSYKKEYAKAMSFYEETRDVAAKGGVKIMQAEALKNIGAALRIEKDYPKAAETLLQAVEIARAAAEKDIEDAALYELANVRYDAEEYAKSAEVLETVLSLRRSRKDKKGESATLDDLGLLFFNTRDYAKAKEYYSRSLALSVELGAKASQASALKDIADCARKLGGADAAMKLYEQSLALWKELKNVKGQINLHHAMASAFKEDRKLAEAVKVYEELLKTAREAGDRKAEINALSEIGGVELDLRDYAKALATFEGVLDMERADRNILGEVDARMQIGISEMGLERPARALEQYSQALRWARSAKRKEVEANFLNFQAAAFEAQGERVKAEEQYRLAASLRRDLGDKKGEAATEKRLAVFYEEGKEYAKAVEVYGRVIEAAKASGDKKVEAQFQNSLAKVYKQMKDYPRAIAAFGEAAESAKTAGDKALQCDSIWDAGYMNDLAGKLNKTIVLLKQALQIARESQDLRRQAKILGQLAGYYERTKEFPKAFDSNKEALRLSRSLGDKKMEANLLKEIASYHQTLGEYSKSMEAFKEALALSRSSRAENTEVETLGDMGSLYLRLGDHSKALELYTQSLNGGRRIKDSYVEANMLNNIGLIHSQLEDYSTALDHFRQAAELYRKIGALADIPEGNTGDIYTAQGKYDEAFKIYSQSKTSLRLGRYYLKTGDPEKALVNFKSIAEGAVKDGNTEIITSAILGSALSYEKMGNLPQARLAFRQAIEKIERQREQLPLSARAHYFAGNATNLPGVTRVEAYEGRTRVASDAKDGFHWAEYTKARLFSESLAAGLVSGLAKLPPELSDSEANLNELVAWFNKERDWAFQAKDDKRWSELSYELEKKKRELGRLVERLRLEYPEYAAVQYPQPLAPDQIAFEPGEVLLEYQVTETKTLLFVVRPDKTVYQFSIPVTRPELKELVQTFRKPFENPTDESGRMTGAFDAAGGAKLYDLLLKPAFVAQDPKKSGPLIAPGSRLVIVPDGILGLIPFEALVTGGVDASLWKTAVNEDGIAGLTAPPGAGYVGDAYDISYAQSATAMTLARTLRKAGRSAGGIFVLADPIFSRSDPRVKGMGLEGYVSREEAEQVGRSVAQRLMGVGGTRESQVSFPRLPETGRLAQKLYADFGKEVVRLVGRDANEAALRQEDLSRYRYLVFATHGLLDTDVPYIREPALVLNQLGNSREEDGFLTLSKVMSLKLNADVVALTACKTGLGRQVSGEGVMGLGRGFQYAGSRNVLVSLWSVAEESTTRLTGTFFKNLRQGKAPREALRRARSDIRAGGYDHPFFWAPFILMGQ